MHAHAYMLNMIIYANGCPYGEIPEETLLCHIHMYMCALACRCINAWDTPTHSQPPPPISTHLTYSEVETPNKLKCNKTWMNWDISILFKDLKSVDTSPTRAGCIVYGWVGGWVDWWVDWWVEWWMDWWVGSCEIIKGLINLDLIEIIQFCLKIYDL